jgi:hypothetical protein
MYRNFQLVKNIEKSSKQKSEIDLCTTRQNKTKLKPSSCPEFAAGTQKVKIPCLSSTVPISLQPVNPSRSFLTFSQLSSQPHIIEY